MKLGISLVIANLFETVVISVEHGRYGGYFLREQSKIQFGVALLYHSPQNARRIDPPHGAVDGIRRSVHFLGMTRVALKLGNQFAAQTQICVLKNVASMGRIVRRRQNQNANKSDK